MAKIETFAAVKIAGVSINVASDGTPNVSVLYILSGQDNASQAVSREGSMGLSLTSDEAKSVTDLIAVFEAKAKVAEGV